MEIKFPNRQPRTGTRSPFGVATLLGLQGGAKHVYGGTVAPAEIARRRAANRAARRSRRLNRKRGA